MLSFRCFFETRSRPLIKDHKALDTKLVDDPFRTLLIQLKTFYWIPYRAFSNVKVRQQCWNGDLNAKLARLQLLVVHAVVSLLKRNSRALH